MSDLPKLRIIRTWAASEEIKNLNQARYSLFTHGPDMIIIVEGHRIISYEELLHLASGDNYKDKEFLEVVLAPALPAGG